MQLLTEAMLETCGVRRGDSVLVALSGGGDSVALCEGVWRLKATGFLKTVFAAHVHHGIRGASADADADFCEAFCGARGIPFFITRVDAPGYAKQNACSLELAARDLRYAFLRKTAQECGASCILTGHHMDDQAETLLLHLLRGCGTRGLAAMAARHGDLARPLLHTRRKDIAAYLAQAGLAYCTDETNAQNCATRNRVRHTLLPELERLNPNAVELLARTAALAGEDDAFLQSLADDALMRAICGHGGYDRMQLAALPPSVQTRAVRRLLNAVSADVTNADIRRVGALLTAQTGTCIELRKGLSAWVDSACIHVGIAPERACFEVALSLDGETVLPTGGRVICRRVSAFRKPETCDEAFLDADALPDALVVRTRRDGDRFFPFGAPGERKLSDYFIDKKVPQFARNVPLIAKGNRIYCVLGHTVSALAAVRPDTESILHIMYKGDKEHDGAEHEG